MRTNPPEPLRLPVGTGVLPACSYLRGKALPASPGWHAGGATGISSRFGPQNLQLLPRPERNTDKIRTGVAEWAAGHRSGNHLIRRLTYAQSAAPAACNTGLSQPSPSRKGYQKRSQKRLFLRRCVKSCILCSEGSCQLLGAGRSVGFLQRTKRAYMDHAAVPAHEGCLRVLISPLVCCLSGLDRSGYDPISA